MFFLKKHVLLRNWRLRYVSLSLSFLVFACAGNGATTSTSTPESASTSETEPEPRVEKPPADHRTAKIPVFPEDPSWGDYDAPVTLVLFSDFECPYCGRLVPTLKGLRERYGERKLRIVWKNHPLPFHKRAMPAHRAGAAVSQLAGDEGFWLFHDLVYENQRELSEENLLTWALRAGVPNERSFQEAVGNPWSTLKVEQDMKLARLVGATGTPATRINGIELSGAQPSAKFEAIIDEQLLRAHELTEAGMRPSDLYPILVSQNARLAPEKAKSAEPKPVDNTIWAIPVYPDDPKKGGNEPLVTIVEFSEFQCPFCQRVTSTLAQILETYGDDVQIVWKDNPLGFHPRAKPAANLARAIYQEKGDAAFWKAHDAIFESQPKLSDSDLLHAVSTLGVSEWRLKQAISKNEFETKIKQSESLAFDFQARGTPQFFINGRRVKGAQPFEEFKKVIDEQLEKASQLLKSGIPRSQIYQEILKTGRASPPVARKKLPPAPADAPFRGKADAKLVIQQFSDFECPFCARVNPTLEQVLKDYGDSVKLVWRNLPLPFHKKAHLAAEAAIEVQQQKGNEAFWAYHDLLFAGQKSRGLERAQLEEYARELGGIDMSRFRRALDQRSHQPRVQADIDASREAGISGTPAFVVGDVFISGAQQLRAFQRAIELNRGERWP